MVAVNLVFALISPASTTCPEGGSRTPCIRHQLRGLAMMARSRRLFRTLCLLPYFLSVMPSKPPLFNTSRCVLPLFIRFAMNEPLSFFSVSLHQRAHSFFTVSGYQLAVLLHNAKIHRQNTYHSEKALLHDHHSVSYFLR